MPTLPTDTLNQIYQKLISSPFVTIVPHKKPDIDAIASAIALEQFIKTHHNNVAIYHHEPLPQNSHFLLSKTPKPQGDSAQTPPQTPSFVQSPSLDLNRPQTICFLDCSALEQTPYAHQLKNTSPQNSNLFTINIDHHLTNSQFANLNLVNSTAAATTEILYHLFQHFKTPITPQIATALLAGLYFDTGSFQHQNTTPATFQVAATLVALQASQSQIIRALYKTTSTRKLKLLGQVLSEATITDKQIAIASLTASDLKHHQATPNDLEGLINHLNTINEAKFSLLLTQVAENRIKGSLRTKNPSPNLANLAKFIAAAAAGGGLSSNNTNQDFSFSLNNTTFGGEGEGSQSTDNSSSGGGHAAAASFEVAGLLNKENLLKTKIF